MGRIWLIAPDGSPVVEQVAQRLGEHFGAPEVLTRSATEGWHSGDAVVVFLEPSDAIPQAERKAWTGLLDSRVEQALENDAPLIPLLVDGVIMPAAERLPAPLQSLAFKHALPLRSDGRLPRDVGRLVEDLESQLRRRVGSAFPYDLWLLPLGAALTAAGLCYSVVLIRDVTDWSFAYETIRQLRRGIAALALAGPLLLGGGALLVSVALWWRQRRKALQQRAECFRRGTGELPEAVNNLAWACFGAGSAAVGWGVVAAIPALVFAYGVGRRAPSTAQKLVVLGLLGAVVGTAWTTAVWLRQRDLRVAVAQYETGRQEMEAGRYEVAADRFQEVTTHWPWYANAHYRLAQSLMELQRDREAMTAIDAAIREYPTGAQGVWAPGHVNARDAYMVRSGLHRNRDDNALADRDSDAADRVGGDFINIFGGMLRFWEQAPQEAK